MAPVNAPPLQPHLFLGLDLGRRQDPAALAIIERLYISTGQINRVTYELEYNLTFVLRHAERLPLGLPYLDIVKRIVTLLAKSDHPRKSLVVDATGVGAPVVEVLTQAPLNGASLIPITITGGTSVAKDPFGGFLVPRRDLLTNLRLLLERKLLQIPNTLYNRSDITQELLDLRDSPTPRPDDLALALSLAAWQSTKNISGAWS